MKSTSEFPQPLIVGIGGLTSEVGKTTLICQLLRAFPGWEAIKTTRGHYRSCGKDPHACCVSDMLEEVAVVRSGKEETYSPGKDTGRYWEAGASNVHWVIATDQQVQAGIKEAVSRVRANGVFVEGNSFSRFVDCDFFVMVARGGDLQIKASAREALQRTSAFYLASGDIASGGRSLKDLLAKVTAAERLDEIPIFSSHNLPDLIGSLLAIRPPIRGEDLEQLERGSKHLKLA